MATIVMAAAVVIVFTALWIGELVSPPVTLRMPHQAFATVGTRCVSNHQQSFCGGRISNHARLELAQALSGHLRRL
jgi:hypothetical protein